MSTESKTKKKVSLKKTEEYIESKHNREMQKRKKRIIRISLLSVIVLFVFVCIVLLVHGYSVTDYNMFFDYIFKLICILINAL